jgi:uncharacterized protein (DUF58 family)
MALDRDAELAELLEEVRRIEAQSRRLLREILVGYTTVFRGRGIEFDTVREYEPGDDPRSVDWNVTARTGRPFVRKYVDERDLTLLFLVDLSASMDGGFGFWSLRQMAARVCACLALSAVHNNDRIGMLGFGASVASWVPAKKGLGHALRIVRDCLFLRGGGTRSDLTPALEFAAGVVRRRAVVFLVSDFLGGGWQRALSTCARRHDVIAVRLSPPELKAPAAGLLRVRDPESSRVSLVDFADERMRAAWRERVETFRQRTDDDLARAGVDVMEVPVPVQRDAEAVVRPIRAFFRMRELRGARR